MCDRDQSPPPLGMWMPSHGQCPRGGACECSRVGVLVNVQEWGCFSIFRRADDVTRTMSKRGGGGVLVNVFTSPFGKAP